MKSSDFENVATNRVARRGLPRIGVGLGRVHKALSVTRPHQPIPSFSSPAYPFTMPKAVVLGAAGTILFFLKFLSTILTVF